MNRFTSCLVVASVIGTATPVCQSRAQPLECGANDQQCLEDGLFLACGQTESDDASCLAWVQSVEAHPLASNAKWRLIAAAGYTHAADLSDPGDNRELYREEARSIYRDVLTTWADGPYARQAYVGLASLTDNTNESVSLLRAGMHADPSNENTPYFLAMALQSRGLDNDYREAADLYRKAYSTWSGYYSAANALRLYALSGEIDQAAEFKAEIARESGMLDFAEEVRSPQLARNLERARSILETACRRYVIAIFGPETCATGIDTLVAAARATNIVSPSSMRQWRLSSEPWSLRRETAGIDIGSHKVTSSKAASMKPSST